MSKGSSSRPPTDPTQWDDIAGKPSSLDGFGLVVSADRMIGRYNTPGTAQEIPCYNVGRNFLASQTITAQRSVLGETYVRTTADIVMSSLTPANVAGLAFSITGGISYRFRFMFACNASLINLGARVAVTGPVFTSFIAMVSGIVTSGGTAAMYSGYLSNYADVVNINGLPTKNVDAPVAVEGFILPSASGTIQLQVGAGALAAPLTVRNGSVGELIRIG